MSGIVHQMREAESLDMTDNHDDILDDNRIKKQTFSINPTPFLNRKSVRKFLLDEAKRTRAHRYTRVSKETMIALNDKVKQACVNHVSRLPSIGRTI